MKANIWAAVSAALLLLSFSMPDLAELLGREQSVQNQYEVSGVLPENLALWSFEQRLQYASLPVELIRLTSPETIKGKQHTAGEMEAAARNWLDSMIDAGLLARCAQDWQAEEAELVLITARESATLDHPGQLKNYYVWYCVMADAENTLEMLLDDETGKPLFIHYGVACGQADTDWAALRWASWCEETYGLTFQNRCSTWREENGDAVYKLSFLNSIGSEIPLYYRSGSSGFSFQNMISD